MQVNYNTNFSKKSTPTFGAIHYSAAEKALRARLTLDELIEFRQLVKDNEQFKNVDLILFGEKNNKIWGRIADSASNMPNELLGSSKLQDYTPRFFESTMHFIKRLIPKMQSRDEKVANLIEKYNFKIEG